MINQDPPTVVRGKTVGDIQSVSNGSSLTIRPPQGEEWMIEIIGYGGACTIAYTDGTNSNTVDSPTSSGIKEKCNYPVTYDLYITVTNSSGGSAVFSYVGYKLLV